VCVCLSNFWDDLWPRYSASCTLTVTKSVQRHIAEFVGATSSLVFTVSRSRLRLSVDYVYSVEVDAAVDIAAAYQMTKQNSL